MASLRSDEPATLRRLQIELIDRCNYRCPLCRSSQARPGDSCCMSVGELRRTVEPVAADLDAVTLYGTQGEPLLNLELEGAVAWLKQATRARVDVSTNGSLVTAGRARQLLAAGLDRIIFSVDGLSESSYAHYRVGGSLARVLDNLRGLCALKRSGGYATRVVLQLIPMAANEHEIAALPELGARLGVDEVRLKISSSVTRKRRLRTRDPAFHAVPGPAGIASCPFGLDKLYLTASGDCYPCCYAEDVPAMRLGHGVRDGLRTAWQHEVARRIRRSFAMGSGFARLCRERCAGRPSRRTERFKLPALPAPVVSGRPS